MSCGQKAVAEDEDDWYDLSKKAGVSDMPWQVYSQEAGHVKRIFLESRGTVKGRMMKLHVKHAMELAALNRKHLDEIRLVTDAEEVLRRVDAV